MSELTTARFASLFATPLLEHMWADSAALNAELREHILEHARSHPGKERTNIGGWHSETGVLEFCGSAGKRLIGRISAMTEEATRRLYAQFSRPPERLEWILSAWANVNRRGDFNNQHMHPGATWSGVYYIDSGESNLDADGTAINLSDPCSPRSTVFFPELTTANVLFKPAPGLMILFPSYVPHSVPPHRGDNPRISIAFNLRRDPYP